MKTILKRAALAYLMAIPSLFNAQADLTIGLNFSYNPPSNCNNQITNLNVDICNNNSTSAGSFLVGIYLYDPSSSKYWVIDQTTVNSLSGNACVTISNWNIDMNNYPSLPAPGNNYRIGVWADTANTVSESDENNNTSLLSGNIQVCSSTSGLKSNILSATDFNISPNPVVNEGMLEFTLQGEEKITVSISDTRGQLVKRYDERLYNAGSHKVNFDANSIEPGIYFATLRTSKGIISKKLVIQ